MKKCLIVLIVAGFSLVGEFPAEAINLKPDNPHDFKGNLTISSGGKPKKI